MKQIDSSGRQYFLFANALIENDFRNEYGIGIGKRRSVRYFSNLDCLNAIPDQYGTSSCVISGS
jgi:hypothetical protein